MRVSFEKEHPNAQRPIDVSLAASPSLMLQGLGSNATGDRDRDVSWKVTVVRVPHLRAAMRCDENRFVRSGHFSGALARLPFARSRKVSGDEVYE